MNIVRKLQIIGLTYVCHIASIKLYVVSVVELKSAKYVKRYYTASWLY